MSEATWPIWCEILLGYTILKTTKSIRLNLFENFAQKSDVSLLLKSAIIFL